MEKWWEERRILLKADGTPRLDGLKVYWEDLKGKQLIDVWVDIPRIGNTSDERLGYPTQKPKGLLERIIRASSNKGDLVADFFCGCGTTIAVAEQEGRNWIGVDISHLAIRLVKDSLIQPYRDNKDTINPNKEKIKQILDSIEVHGLPKDIASARELAEKTEGGRIAFQDWVIEVMLGGVSNIKKGADGGSDGYLIFGNEKNKKELVLIEVKSGNASVKNIREFIQVIKTKKAAIGAFVCFKEQITKPMEHEAKEEGYYDQGQWQTRFPRVQIISVQDLLEGETVHTPQSPKGTFKTAKFRSKKSNQESLSI